MSDTRLISRSPIKLLTEDHELLGSLLEAYDDLAPEQTAEQIDLLQRIDEEIARHIGTEEALFYPTLLQLHDPRVRERVAGALAEHRVLESVAMNVREADTTRERDAAVKSLRRHALRHMDFEELEVFPFCWGLPRVTLNQMGLEIEERRSREGFF